MNLAFENWSTKDLLESGAYIVAILTGLFGFALFLYKRRKDSIEKTRAKLIGSWTNEGSINSEETAFIQIIVEDYQGDIIGELEGPTLSKPLDINADIGWRTTRLTISELHGRSVEHIATAHVRLSGNFNRLKWKIHGSKVPDFLPKKTELWPVAVGSRDSTV